MKNVLQLEVHTGPQQTLVKEKFEIIVPCGICSKHTERLHCFRHQRVYWQWCCFVQY